MATKFVRLLGRVEVEQGDNQTHLSPGQVAQFLAYLAYRGDWLSREELAFLYWPDRVDSVARRNLRKLLHRARQHADGIEVEGELLRWSVPTDVQAWREALAQQDWSEAFRLYRGPLLEELDSGATVEFSAWLEQEREQLQSAWREALLHHTNELTKENPDRAARLLRRFLDTEPLDEAVLQAHLRALAAAGQYGDIEQAYRTFAQRLETDLGLEPSAETQALCASLQQAGEREPDSHVEQVVTNRPPLAPVRAPTPDSTVFVGRERELEWLSEHLARAVSDQGGAVAIEGEAGVGKTRLVEAFLARTAEVRVFSGRCFERELVAPLEPVRAALAGLRNEAVPQPEGERFWSAAPSDRSTVHQGLTARLVRAAGQGRGAVLFIDDVQWADAATLEFLSYAAKRVYNEPVLIVLSYRREDRKVLDGWLAHLAERRALKVLSLGRLELAQTAALLSELADVSVDDLAWLSTFVHRESEGNPFYALEYLRWLRDTGVLELDERQRITALQREQLLEAALPESVRALIRARYQAFAGASRDALDLAAVIGKTFALEFLERASESEPLALWSALEPLLSSGLIVAGVGEQYAFSHDKLRQTIYDGIGPPLRRALHLRVAAALLQHGAEDAELAHHYLRAHAWPEAFRYLELAAQEAERNHAWETALQGYARALDLVDRLPEADYKRFSLLQARERLLEYMERQPEWATTVEQMAALAERLGNPRLQAEAQLKRMALLMHKGNSAEAVEARERAIRLFSDLGDTSAEARVHRERAYTAWTRSDYQELLEASLEALRLYQALGNRRAEAAISGNIAQAYRRLEQHEQALEWAERAATIYQELGDELGKYLRLDTLSWVHIQRGNGEASAALLEQILPIAEKLGDKHLMVEKHMNLGQFYLKMDDPERALGHFRAGARLGAEIGDPRHEGYPLMSTGATLQRLGDVAAAAQAYRRAVRLLETAHAVSGMPDEQIAQADALTLLAGVLRHDKERNGEALAAFEAAEAVFRQHGESLRLSKLLMDRGALYWRLGRLESAAHDFEQAFENAQQAGGQARATAALASLGVIYRDLGRLEDSTVASLTALEQLEDRQAEAYVLTSLASSYRLLARFSEARACLERSLELRRDLGDVAGEAEVLSDLADLEKHS